MQQVTISPAQRYGDMTTELVERARAGKHMSQRWHLEYDRVRRAAEKAETVRYAATHLTERQA